MAEQTEIPILDVTREQMAHMTGWDLMQAVGIMDKVYRSWHHNDVRDFALNGRTWHAYTTGGRGRHSHTTYVHVYREIQRRVVDPDGTDTGLRVDDVVHLRGKASAKIAEFQDVS